MIKQVTGCTLCCTQLRGVVWWWTEDEQTRVGVVCLFAGVGEGIITCQSCLQRRRSTARCYLNGNMVQQGFTAHRTKEYINYFAHASWVRLARGPSTSRTFWRQAGVAQEISAPHSCCINSHWASRTRRLVRIKLYLSFCLG